MSNAALPGSSSVAIIGVKLDVRGGDAVYSGDDLGLVAGAAYCAQRFELLAKAAPGDVLFHPTFGAGLGDLVDEPFTQQVQAEVEARMAALVASEPYVALVMDVDAQMTDAGILVVDTSYVPVGGALPQVVRTVVGRQVSTT